MPDDVDTLAVMAHADLVGRTGATELQIGYLHDGVPTEQADWWATARYRGAKVTVEHHIGPVEAVEALARRLLTGGRCTACNETIELAGSDDSATPQVPEPREPQPPVHRNPVQWAPAVVSPPPVPRRCRWRREGGHWVRGCDGVTPR